MDVEDEVLCFGSPCCGAQAAPPPAGKGSLLDSLGSRGGVTSSAPLEGMNQNKKPHLLRFHAFSLSLEVIGQLRGLVDVIRRHDAPLAKQLSRAASSVSLNLAESRGRRGGDRMHLLRIAKGSAEESAACLYVAQAWGYLDEAATKDALGQLDHLLGMLGSLTR